MSRNKTERAERVYRPPDTLVPGLARFVDVKSSVQEITLSTGERDNFHIIGHHPGSFASSSSALPRSYHPDASAVSAGALPYSETKTTWKMFRVAIL